MARVMYNAGEVDPNHRVLEGIRSTLRASHTNRARTTVAAVDMIDLEDVDSPSPNLKIEHICKTLDCRHERDGDEVVFTQ